MNTSRRWKNSKSNKVNPRKRPPKCNRNLHQSIHDQHPESNRLSLSNKNKNLRRSQKNKRHLNRELRLARKAKKAKNRKVNNQIKKWK